MNSFPVKPFCPFEREDGDGCYSGSYDANGVFTGDWCCEDYDHTTDTCTNPGM